MLDRETRRLVHSKGSRIKSVTAPPIRGEGRDGDMQIYNGHLYIKDKFIWHHFIPKSGFKADKILIGDNDEEAQAELKYSGTTTIVQDLHTLMAKINKIIELLQLDIK